MVRVMRTCLLYTSSIKEMADLVASQIAKSSIEVIVNTHSDTKTDKFLPELKMNLSVDWLKNLGWTPHFSLANAFERRCV